jgi:hypothetical protein
MSSSDASVASAQRGEANLQSLTIGVASLVAVFGAFTLTGAAGRVLRNEPDKFRLAVIFVLVGTAFLVISALPNTSGLVDLVCALAGIGLSFVGLLVGTWAAAASAKKLERPALSAQLVDEGLHLKGTAKVESRSSDTRVVLLVEGLVTSAEDPRFFATPTTLEQIYAGPDGDGKVVVPIDLVVPSGRFEAVGVRSWTERDPLPDPDDHASESSGKADAAESSGKDDAAESLGKDVPCARYPRKVSGNNSDQQGLVHDAGTGCLTLALPPIPERPQMAMSWQGMGNNAERVQIDVNTKNAPIKLPPSPPTCKPAKHKPCPSLGELQAVRVAVQVKAELPGRTQLLYRGMLQPDATGKLTSSIQLPVPDHVLRVCAVAMFVRTGAGFFSSDDGCPLHHARARRRALIELRARSLSVGAKKPAKPAPTAARVAHR